MSPDNPTTAPSIFQAEDCSSSVGPSVTWTGIGSSFAFYATKFASSSKLAMPKTGKVTVRFKSKMTAFDAELWLAYPEDMLIFNASSNNLGQTYDVGTFAASTRLVFALKTPGGHAYYTDSSLNRDGCGHTRKLQLGTDR